ncbi:hypothetical protein ECZU51_20420 [Escherichia coli]|nr:hypothetical protein ECZU51_20420 [Escherichia coli]
MTDGLGRTRYHQWDAQNQVTAYRDEAGQVTTFRWSDEERLLLGMTDAQGGKWRYVYDRQGHITETHDPLGRVAQTVAPGVAPAGNGGGRGGEQLVL